MFNWRDFFTLAKELQVGDEAHQRSAISRAYYSAFCRSRDLARLNPSGMRDSHKAVSDWYITQGDPVHSEVGTELAKVKISRVYADYHSRVLGLERMTAIAMNRVSQIHTRLDEIEAARAGRP